MPYYATLSGCRTTLLVGDSTTGDDQKIADLIPRASQWVDDYCNQSFDERIVTLYLSARVGTYDLEFRGVPFIDVTSLYNGDGTAISTSDFVLYPRNQYPKTRLQLKLTNYWQAPTDMPVFDDPDGIHLWEYAPHAWIVDGIQLVGKVGFHQDYSNAWENSGITVSGSLNSSSTSLVVTAAGALDVGHVLKIGTEYMAVTGPVANTSSATTFTVKRGWNGSTAAAHSNGDAIYIWRTEPTIVEATERLVAAMYKGRENATGDRLVVEGLGAISIPSGIPSKVRDLLTHPYVNVIRGIA